MRDWFFKPWVSRNEYNMAVNELQQQIHALREELFFTRKALQAAASEATLEEAEKLPEPANKPLKPHYVRAHANIVIGDFQRKR
jgi:hypothetical protein